MTTTKVNLANIVEGILPVANGGTGTSTGAAPGGSTTQVQYNNAGAFAGSANLVWDNTNARLGIGVTSPSTQLQMNSSAATYSDQLRIRNTNFGNADIGVGSGIMAIATDMSNITFYTSSNLGTTGSAIPNNERMRIDSSGNVGIGTSSASSRLTIDGGTTEIRSGNALMIRPSNNANDNRLVALSTAGLDVVWGGAPTTSVMHWANGGNVGIGTSSPAFASGTGLEVQRTGDATVRVERTDATASAGEFVAGSGLVKIGATSGHPFAFITNNTEQMRIDTSGNLLFNSGYGSVATAYGCRAWINFNGTGTPAPRGSGNVSSIGDNGTGNYTLNFATAMPDTGYSAVGTCGSPSAAHGIITFVQGTGTVTNTSGVQFGTSTLGGGNFDYTFVCMAIFR